MSVTRSHFLSCKNQWSLLLTEPQRLAYIDKHANPISSDPLPLPGPYSIRLGFSASKAILIAPPSKGAKPIILAIIHQGPQPLFFRLCSWVLLNLHQWKALVLPVHVTVYIGVHVPIHAHECAHKKTNQTPVLSSACGEMDL